MGFIHVDVDVSNPVSPGVTESLRVLVDTGAILSVLPSNMLDSLGILREGRRRFLGFGGPVARDTGIVRMTYKWDAAGASVVFGAEDDPPIMGVTALEALGYEADPVNGRLNLVDMLML